MGSHFTHPNAGERESAGATGARERGLRPLSEITRTELAAAARLMGREVPTKTNIRAAIGAGWRMSEWHHIERSGRVKREWFTSPMRCVAAVEDQRRRDDDTARMIEEQRSLGFID